MSQEKEKYEQQILFNESPDLSNLQAGIDNQPDNQVILPEAAWQPIDESFSEDIVEVHMSKPRWLWRLAGISFSTLIVYELIDFLVSGFSNSPITTAIYSVFFMAIGTISGLALLKELRGLRQFKLQTKNQR